MILYDSGHRFDLSEYGIGIPLRDEKMTLTLEFLKNHPVLGKHMDELSVRGISEIISKEDLLRVHSKEYVNKLYSEKLEYELMRTYELIDEYGRFSRYDPFAATKPLPELFKNELRKDAGTVQCCRVALNKGFCFYFGGGSHHAKKDYGEGFCLLNDIVIAIRKLQTEKLIENVWVIDLDAHKGDGTAALTYGDPSVTTLSIHMAEGWPLNMPEFIGTGPDQEPNPTFTPSNIDVPVAAGEDAAYVGLLDEALRKLGSYPRPQLAIVVMGADPYEKDELPSSSLLKLTLSQMLDRDMLVYRFLEKRGIPQACLMSGGYGAECWKVYAQFLEKVLPEQLNRS